MGVVGRCPGPLLGSGPVLGTGRGGDGVVKDEGQIRQKISASPTETPKHLLLLQGP